MDTQELKVGDRVRVRNFANAPDMTVTVDHGNQGTATVQWFTTTGELQIAFFKQDELQKIPPKRLHGNTVLTEAALVKIRAEYKAGGITQKKLAEKYKVNPSTVHYIVRDTKRRK